MLCVVVPLDGVCDVDWTPAMVVAENSGKQFQCIQMHMFDKHIRLVKNIRKSNTLCDFTGSVLALHNRSWFSGKLLSSYSIIQVFVVQHCWRFLSDDCSVSMKLRVTAKRSHSLYKLIANRHCLSPCVPIHFFFFFASIHFTRMAR